MNTLVVGTLHNTSRYTNYTLIAGRIRGASVVTVYGSREFDVWLIVEKSLLYKYKDTQHQYKQKNPTNY